MPSKLLIAAAKAAHAVGAAEAFGIRAGSVSIDGQAVMRRVRRMRDEFVASALQSIEEIPSKARLKGIAKFVGPDRLAVDGQQIRAGAIVIATGSRPIIPDTFEGLDGVLTNQTVFELADLPSSLAVVGAGPLGLELAQAFSRLGVDVEVFDEGDTVAALKDETAGAALRAILEREFPLRLGTSIKAKQAGDGIKISWSGASAGERIVSHVLMAAGRPPNLKALGLEQTGIALDKHGTPIFDRATMRCGTSSIFLAGDCDADIPVLHEASAEGEIAGDNAARYPDIRQAKRQTPLAITFTDPPSASIGSPAGDDAVIGETDFSDQGRAKIEDRGAGILRVYADRDGKLTGAAMAAPAAEHLAHLVAWAIEQGQTAAQLLDMPIYHPTYEEGLRTALRQIRDRMDAVSAADGNEDSASIA
jgi:dihydrolipoamide dehydrogenase